MPVTLAIECSQREAGVALMNDQGEVHVELLRGMDRHDDDLLPAIDRAFRSLRLPPQALGVVGVSIGPGGFTGLRIAVSTVKAMAETLGSKVIAVPSALVAAHSTLSSHDGVHLIALCSKTTSIWASEVIWSSGRWTFNSPPSLKETDDFSPGRYASIVADEHLPEMFRIRATAARTPLQTPKLSPEACLKLTQLGVETGSFADAVNLVPLYPREPEAVRLWKPS